MAGFRLAEAYTELTARTRAHDAAVDKSVEKIKLYGLESQRVQTMSTKMFGALLIGAGSAEAVIGKVAGALRNLGSKLLEAAKSGDSFGDAIARWSKETFGLENAVTRLDARLKQMNVGSALATKIDILFGRGGTTQIEGLTPERSEQIQAARAAITKAELEAQGKVDAVQAQIEAHGGLQAPRGSAGAFREAQQEVDNLRLAMNRLNDEVVEEIKAREESTKRLKEQLGATGQNSAMIGARLGEILNGLFGNATNAVNEAAGGAGGMMGRGARMEADEVARLIAEAERAINNADPEIFGRVRGGGAVGERTRATLMSGEDAARQILSATTGQDPADLQRQGNDHLKAMRAKMDEQLEELRKKGPAHAVWAEGAIA